MKTRLVFLSWLIALFTAIGSAHGGSHGGSEATGTATGQLVSSNVLIPAVGLLLATGALIYVLKQTGYLAKFKPGGR